MTSTMNYARSRTVSMLPLRVPFEGPLYVVHWGASESLVERDSSFVPTAAPTWVGFAEKRLVIHLRRLSIVI
jgi:hypothetical protein